jgi:hypothetical protein
MCEHFLILIGHTTRSVSCIGYGALHRYESITFSIYYTSLPTYCAPELTIEVINTEDKTGFN